MRGRERERERERTVHVQGALALARKYGGTATCIGGRLLNSIGLSAAAERADYEWQCPSNVRSEWRKGHRLDLPLRVVPTSCRADNGQFAEAERSMNSQ